jgi:predicted oxidoreductase (fatty acid repression mutant protein)
MFSSKKWYMQVDVEQSEDRVNFQVWFSPDPIWTGAGLQHFHKYTHANAGCEWLITANKPLTTKALALLTEYADDMCAKQQKKNDNRKLANR